MASVTLSATPNGNGYQATLKYSNGTSFSSAEVYPSIEEAISMAALKLLRMPDRLEAFDREAGAGVDVRSNVVELIPRRHDAATSDA
ncbi:hypothetical protein [Sphingobium sp. MP9-4]|jgi:hypothetical protein|uniref:hypothetical protein n=1 Tax=Sphingobium sp. MP9-4 TaxID=1761936 RepID=UPI001484CF63|nr:hypothetical protein [Sphingobium sp. MP9-4]